MPFVPAPQIVQVEVRALFAGQKIENRFMIDALTTVTPELVDDITNVVSVWAIGTYFGALPSAVSLVETVGTDMSAADGSTHTIIPEGSVTGGQSGAPMPNEVTFCVSLRSASRGRSARSRSFVLGLVKADVNGNNLDTGVANNYVSIFQSLIDAIATEGWALVVVSYITNGAPRVGGPVYYPLLTATMADTVVDSQRRRKPGNGS